MRESGANVPANSLSVRDGGPDVVTFRKVTLSARAEDTYTQQMVDEWLDAWGQVPFAISSADGTEAPYSPIER